MTRPRHAENRGRYPTLGEWVRLHGVTGDWDLSDDELRAAGSVKWTWEGPDVLPAWVAEMDVRPCPAVHDALADALQRGALGYPPRDDVSGLPEVTAAFLERRFGWAVDPGRVVVCGDVMAGVRLVLDALCERAPVVVPVPSYPPFLDVPGITGRPLVTVPCTGPAGTALELDLDGIEAALRAGARTVLLAQPHNPTGRVFTATELAALAQVCARHGARVISDEIHSPLVLDGAHVPYAVAVQGVPDALWTTITAATKAWNVPGLKCAQIVAATGADLAALRGVPHVANHGTSPLGIVASIAAYTSGEPWLESVLDHLRAQRDLFGSLLAQRFPDAEWSPMQATYLAWVHPGESAGPDPSARALRHGVFVNPGHTFGSGYDGWVRVNLATSAERLHRIADRLAAAWVG